jgi:hypothetical protein
MADRANFHRAVATLLLALTATPAPAAPLSLMEPVSFCGTVVDSIWVAARDLPGLPGASGSLGHDRTVPAQMRLVLQDVSGIDADTAARISFLVGIAPDETGVVVLLESQYPLLRITAARVCIKDYTISGDEGITLTHHADLTVLRSH